MKKVKANLFNMGGRKKGKATAQVRVMGISSEFGFAGPDRIVSITRHVVHENYNWVGNNPDYRAPGLNDSAEKRSANANQELENCTRKLALLEDQLKNFAENNAKLANPLKGLEITAAKDEIREKIRKAKIRLAEAEAEAPAAKLHLEKIQEEFPRLCQFTF